MPQTIFIDQDQEITRALDEVMLRAYHGLSTRHLMQNSIYQLHNLMKGGSCLLSEATQKIPERITRSKIQQRRHRTLFIPEGKEKYR